MPFRRLTLLIVLACDLAQAAQAEVLADDTPRIAVISAFGPETIALEQATAQKQVHLIAGTRFTTGVLEGRPVVLFLSGVSMVNAAMTTQLALDHFNISRIVVSGVAGGVDPALAVGDVVVADRWSEYLESVLAREVSPGRFAPPSGEPVTDSHFGMLFPKAVQVSRTPGVVELKTWFAVDPVMLAAARQVAGQVRLKRCAASLCLKATPRVTVGGDGVSGQSFVDNAAFRTYAYQTFQAKILDMESAAVAHVAYVNRTPFIAFRSLSDLAGGDPRSNQAPIFFKLASDNSAAVVRAFLAALPPAAK